MKRPAVVVLLALAFPASALAWGGSYTTGDSLGTSVEIQVDDAYPVDQTLPQRWAAFLGTLVHGPELATLNLRLAPLDVVQRICGSSALACYEPATKTLEASPEDELGEPSAREVIAHEYGHHIANSRDNAPWNAEDYGTKRWASYENVCARVAAGTASPGSEGANYRQNPGEAFAETYRVLNLQAEGATTPPPWTIVDRSFYPDATALRLLDEDIVSPWTGPTVRHVRGSFGGGTVRTVGVSTPLDGTFVARLHAARTERLRLDLYVGGRLVGHATRSLSFQVCGQRVLTLKVERLSGKGVFTLDVSKP